MHAMRMNLMHIAIAILVQLATVIVAVHPRARYFLIVARYCKKNSVDDDGES